MNSDGDLTYEEVRKIVVGMPDKLERESHQPALPPATTEERATALAHRREGRFQSKVSLLEGKGDGSMNKGGLERRRVSASRSSTM